MRTTDNQMNTEIELGKATDINKQDSWTYSSRVVKSLKDAKTAKCCTVLFYFVLCIGTVGIAYYQMTQFLDDDINSVTRSEIIPLGNDGVTFPYFYVEKYLFETIDLIAVKMADDTTILPSEIRHIQAEDFIYNAAINSWTVVQNDDGHSLLIVPPYDQTLAVGDSIGLQIRSSSQYAQYLVDASDSLHEEVIQHFTQGLRFGIFWKADTVDHLKNGVRHIYTNTSQNDETKFEQLEFTMASTWNFIQIDSFKTINHINTTKNDAYFEMNEKASILWQDFTNKNITSSTYEYTTIYYFYINPVGGGVETVLTTDRLYGYFDIFSKTGGIFSPFKDGLLMFLSWVLFGVPFCACAGIASKKALDDDEKKRIRVYLEEVGLLTDQNIDKIERKKTENKNGCCSCC